MKTEEIRTLAIDAIAAGQFDRASDYVKTGLQDAPEDPELLGALGFLQAQSGQLEQARDTLLKAITYNPQGYPLFNHLGNVYRASGNYEDAQRAYQSALRLKGNYPEALNNLGALFYRQGKFKEALSFYEKAYRLDSKSPDILYNLANTYIRLDQTNAGRGMYEQLLAISPEHLGACHNLGILLASTGELSAAEPYLRKALPKDTESYDAHYHLALVYAGSGQNEDAIELYKKVLHQQPKHGHAHHNIATLYLSQQCPSLALTHFRKAHTLNPSNRTAEHFVASLEGKQEAAPPKGFVKDLFDFYAQSYDHHLKQSLNYQVPHELRVLMAPYKPLGDTPWFGIDIGCGTGLCAPAFNDIVYRLVGIDLSPKMLNKARMLGAYHRLHEGDIVEQLAKHYLNCANIVIAADVLVYFGQLTHLLAAVSHALKPGGYFVFSIEQLIEGDWLLQPSGRYAHSRSYLEQVCAEVGLAPVDTRAVMLREHFGEPLNGLAMVFRKASSE